jgi:hypothetical protein
MRPFREMKTKELKRIEDIVMGTAVALMLFSVVLLVVLFGRGLGSHTTLDSVLMILMCFCFFFPMLMMGWSIKYLASVRLSRQSKPAPPKPMSELERRLEMAQTLVQADRIRKKFLADNNIAEHSELAEQVNVLFTEYEVRLKDPDSG